jgi:hypothetical protein
MIRDLDIEDLYAANRALEKRQQRKNTRSAERRVA